MGAVAVGGTAELQTFGDGAIASSYLNHIKSVGNYTAGGYLRGLEKYSGLLENQCTIIHLVCHYHRIYLCKMVST